MSKLVSFREYARHRERAVSYISKLVAQGRIPLSEGRKIDVEEADAAMLRNVRQKGSPRVTKPKPSAPAATSEPIPTDDQGPAVYGFELARLTRAKAAAAEMELSERRGELVNRAEFERKSAAFDDLMKRRISGLPSKLAPLVADQPARKAFAILDAEMRELLAEFNQITDEQVDAHVLELFPQVNP